jgi:hypothetical protein
VCGGGRWQQRGRPRLTPPGFAPADVTPLCSEHDFADLRAFPRDSALTPGEGLRDGGDFRGLAGGDAYLGEVHLWENTDLAAKAYARKTSLLHPKVYSEGVHSSVTYCVHYAYRPGGCYYGPYGGPYHSFSVFRSRNAVIFLDTRYAGSKPAESRAIAHALEYIGGLLQGKPAALPGAPPEAALGVDHKTRDVPKPGSAFPEGLHPPRIDISVLAQVRLTNDVVSLSRCPGIEEIGVRKGRNVRTSGPAPGVPRCFLVTIPPPDSGFMDFVVSASAAEAEGSFTRLSTSGGYYASGITNSIRYAYSPTGEFRGVMVGRWLHKYKSCGMFLIRNVLVNFRVSHDSRRSDAPTKAVSRIAEILRNYADLREEKPPEAQTVAPTREDTAGPPESP